jgi:hypothetical protein
VEKEELHITYDVGGGGGGGGGCGSSHLEAACDGPILLLLNTQADQSMQVRFFFKILKKIKWFLENNVFVG